MIKVEKNIAGRPLKIESGQIARQAGGSVFISYGETAILATVCCSSEPREGIDFLPMVDESFDLPTYEEIDSNYETPEALLLAQIGKAYGSDMIRARARNRRRRLDYLRGGFGGLEGLSNATRGLLKIGGGLTI